MHLYAMLSFSLARSTFVCLSVCIICQLLCSYGQLVLVHFRGYLWPETRTESLMRAVLLLGNFSADRSSREDFFKGECWDLLSRVELVSLGPAVLK